MISNIAIIFTNLKEVFETAAKLNEEVKERVAKNSNFYSIDFLHVLAKPRKSVEKMTHRKKNRGYRTSKIVTSTQKL